MSVKFFMELIARLVEHQSIMLVDLLGNKKILLTQVTLFACLHWCSNFYINLLLVINDFINQNRDASVATLHHKRYLSRAEETSLNSELVKIWLVSGP